MLPLLIFSFEICETFQYTFSLEHMLTTACEVQWEKEYCLMTKPCLRDQNIPYFRSSWFSASLDMFRRRVAGLL